MAGAAGRCPDCSEADRARGRGRGVPPCVPHLGIAVDEGDVLPGALRLVRELRPGWEPARVKTKVWPPPQGGRGGSPWGGRRACVKGAPRSRYGGLRDPPRGLQGLPGGEYILAPSMLSKERGCAGVHRSPALTPPPAGFGDPLWGEMERGLWMGAGPWGLLQGVEAGGRAGSPPSSIALLGGAAGPRNEGGVGYQRCCTAAWSPRGAEQEFSRELASSRAGTAGSGAGGCVALQPCPLLHECQVLGCSSGGCVFTGGHKAGPQWSWAHRDARTCARVSSDGAHFPCAWSVIKNVLIAKCN